MAAKTKDFFENGTSHQFEWILDLYDQALRLKAESKSSKPENVIKLDKWYQNELPKKIKSRGKEAHLTHEELVQTIKWKLARGKFRPNLTNLIQMNTPRVVMQETKKAFRKIHKTDDLFAAVQALCNLKGVGPAMASAILAAGAPQLAPFMADECLLSMPDFDCLDYTMKEYMRYVEHVNACVQRLSAEGGTWSPHRVELAVWTHYIANNLKPELLKDLPIATSPGAKADEATSASLETVADDASSEKVTTSTVPSNGQTNSNGNAKKDEEETGGVKPEEKDEKTASLDEPATTQCKQDDDDDDDDDVVVEAVNINGAVPEKSSSSIVSAEQEDNVTAVATNGSSVAADTNGTSNHSEEGVVMKSEEEALVIDGDKMSQDDVISASKRALKTTSDEPSMKKVRTDDDAEDHETTEEQT